MKGSKRKGVALVATLVCMLIVMAMLGSMLLFAVRARRQLHVERNLRQCELLLRAGIDRGVLRLSSEADYRGETWTLPAAAIIGVGQGRVTIDVSRESQDMPWQLQVVAEYPLGDETSIRRSRTVSFPSKHPPSEEFQ